MLEKTTRLVSEGLARGINRRSFLRRTGETVFAGVAALAAGQALPKVASAYVGRQPPTPLAPQCAPPGPYCNIDGNPPSLSGCRGSTCFQHLYNGTVYQCRVYYQWYQAGCWTTASGGGYWTCCDCECGNPRVTSCGCAQFSTGPVPHPDKPGAMVGA